MAVISRRKFRDLCLLSVGHRLNFASALCRALAPVTVITSRLCAGRSPHFGAVQLRDMPLKKQGKYRFEDFEVDLAHRSFRREGHTVTIGVRTFDLLVFLVQNPQRVIGKDELMHALWANANVEESNLSQHIFLLRKALTGAQSGDRLLVTIPGRGYRFTPSVADASESIAGIDLLSEDDPQSLPEMSSPARRIRGVAGSSVQVQRGKTAARKRKPEEVESGEHPSSPNFLADFSRPGPWHVAILTAVFVLLLFIGIFVWRRTHRPSHEPITLVLADFTNTTGNSQFDASLQTALTIDLQQSPFLTAASPATASQGSGETKAGAEKPFTPALARESCAHIHGGVYLTGAIRTFGTHYLVAARAFRCSDGGDLAASRGIADSPDAVVAVLDKVAADLRRQLGESPRSVANYSKPLFADHPANLEALKAYTDASRLRLQGNLEQSLTLLQHAVEIDPQFALAFSELGAVYSELGQRDQAVAALTRAFQLRDSLDEPGRLQVVAAYNDAITGDLQASVRNYKDWSEEYPRNPVPLTNLAQREIQIGRMAQALDPAQRALKLNPADPLNYAALARAQLSLGQVDTAADTCQLAISRHLDTELIHGFLLQIAFLRLDQPAIDAQLAWARGANDDKLAQPYMMMQQGLMDFAQGKAKAGQAAFTTAAAGFSALGESDRAGRILGAMSRIEAELGLTETAYAQLVRLSNSAESSAPDATDIPVAWAHTGETSRAAAILKRELDAYPSNTLWQEDFAPQIKAAIALNRQLPANALEDLKPAIPFDLRSFEVPAMRGRAYLAAKQSGLAEAEFHKILDHPGIEPLSHNYPLAQLGLARAEAQEGKTADAGFAYKLVLQIWKDADSDLPRLKEAKAEYARLTGEPAKPSVSTHSSAKPPISKPTAGRR
jgi:DNA-binding winged helix-turn-helix (wHTH) protein/tetratricopeptide (TPR) repeat protein